MNFFIKNTLDHGGVNFQPGKDAAERGHPQIVDAYGGCTHKDDLVFEPGRVDVPFKDVGN